MNVCCVLVDFWLLFYIFGNCIIVMCVGYFRSNWVGVFCVLFIIRDFCGNFKYSFYSINLSCCFCG